MKCAVFERVQRTIRDSLYKYFTDKNTYIFIEKMPIFVKIYNETFHSTTCMAPSPLTDSDMPTIWKWMEARGSVRVAKATFRVARQYRIINEKMRFAKAAEQNLTQRVSSSRK